MKHIKSTVALLLFALQLAVAEFAVYQLYGYQGLLFACGVGVFLFVIIATITSIGD